MLRVLINNDFGYQIEEELVRDQAGKTLRELGKEGEYEISVSFVNEEVMKKLHRKYMAELGYEEELHDVLSFPLDEGPDPEGVTHLGDTVICYPYAISLGEDPAFLIDHSIRHLVGIHHD